VSVIVMVDRPTPYGPFFANTIGSVAAGAAVVVVAGTAVVGVAVVGAAVDAVVVGATVVAVDDGAAAFPLPHDAPTNVSATNVGTSQRRER
jgi:hypothetical protein